MRKNPQLTTTPVEKRLRLVRALERTSESNRFTFLQLDLMNGRNAFADRIEANDMRLPRQTAPAVSSSGLFRRHPMRARTPGLGGPTTFPVISRPYLADFFARRQAFPARDGSRYDIAYQPAAIAASFLHYPLHETSLSQNG